VLQRPLGWDDLLCLPGLVNPNRPARAALPPQTVSIIAARNEYDVELHDYANRLPDKRVAAAGDGFAKAVERSRAENRRYFESVAAKERRARSQGCSAGTQCGPPHDRSYG
jgi:hypothetical protein